MAYATSTATDCNDLLDKLRIFLVANGWTVDFWGNRTVSSGGGKNLSVHKGASHGTFHSDFTVVVSADPSPYLAVTIHDAWVTNANPDVLPNRSILMWSNKMAGPFKAHHFFEGTVNGKNYIYVVVETTTGFFKHFGFGRMDYDGTLTTGQFAIASRWYYDGGTHVDNVFSTYHRFPWASYYNNRGESVQGTVIRADCDGTSPKWFFTDASISAQRRIKAGFLEANTPEMSSITELSQAQPSDETGRAVLVPIVCMVERASSLWSNVGVAPNTRFVNVKDLEPAQELIIGSDTWMVFPMHRKVLVTNAPYSGDYGYAYLKN